MSFFNNVIAKASKKAETLTNATMNASSNIANSKLARIAEAVATEVASYAAVPVVIAIPVVSKAYAKVAAYGNSVMESVEKLAEEPKK